MSELAAWCDANGVDLPTDGEQKINDYLDSLYELNAKRNVTRVPRERAMLRHVIDSLLLSRAVEITGQVADLGTGPGLPAWPLALFFPEAKLRGVDGSSRRFAPAEEHPLPNLRMVQRRAEDPIAGSSHVVTGRAFAPLATQLECSARWARMDGLVVPYRTDGDELLDATALGLELERVEKVRLDGETVRVFPVYRKVRRLAGRPRSWADLKARPHPLPPI